MKYGVGNYPLNLSSDICDVFVMFVVFGVFASSMT